MSETKVSRRSTIAKVLRVSSGNLLEMYDFMIFGYYAASIGKAFFPSSDPAHGEFVSLILSLTTFGAGFLARPLGAIFLGAYIDKHGRRAGLVMTLALMSVGTVVIAALPGYATIGILAPLLVLVSRLIQGFSAGVELGGVSVYLSEIATPGNKGFYVAWQSGSLQLAVVLAAVTGVVLNVMLPEATMQAWGWRIPLLMGCAIIPYLFYIRSSLEETEAFKARKKRLTAREIFSSMLDNWRLMVLGAMMVLMTTVSFYLITAYTPTFGKKVLHLTDIDSLLVTLCVGLSNLLWLPLSGALSDRIGRRPILVACAALAMCTAYPIMSWLITSPSFMHLLLVELWLSFIYACYNGAMIVYLTEIMPEEVRTSGFSLAYSMATIVGGMTPAVSTALIEKTGNGAMPGLWMAGAGALALVAILLMGSRAMALHQAPA